MVLSWSPHGKLRQGADLRASTRQHHHCPPRTWSWCHVGHANFFTCAGPGSFWGPVHRHRAPGTPVTWTGAGWRRRPGVRLPRRLAGSSGMNTCVRQAHVTTTTTTTTTPEPLWLKCVDYPTGYSATWVVSLSATCSRPTGLSILFGQDPCLLFRNVACR